MKIDCAVAVAVAGAGSESVVEGVPEDDGGLAGRGSCAWACALRNMACLLLPLELDSVSKGGWVRVGFLW